MMFHENEASYKEWRAAKLAHYPQSSNDLEVEIGGLEGLLSDERNHILESFSRTNMAIYTCRDPSVDRQTIKTFAANFGLQRLDHHLCANDDGVAELTVATEDRRAGYVPYSDRSLSWHTDGYYNEDSRQVHAVVLHCAEAAQSGGENAILDPEVAYIRLRDADPAFVSAFEHLQCMTIPANR